MSKRSYRRLAVVAGAALAVGSMAPAMAVRVDGAGVAGANASVETVDVNDLLPQSVNIPLPGTAFIGGTLHEVKSDLHTAKTLLVGDVHDIVSAALGCTDLGVNAVGGVSAAVLANATVGTGGLNGAVRALVNAPVFVATDGLFECLDGVKVAVGDTVSDAKLAVGNVAGTATVAATTAAAYATTLPSAVLNTAGGIIFNDALTAILSVRVAGAVSTSSSAGLASSVLTLL